MLRREVSRRAAIKACTVSGNGRSDTRTRLPRSVSSPWSVSRRTNSSAYSGLPPARSSSSDCASAGNIDWPSRAPSNTAVRSSSRGASDTVVDWAPCPPAWVTVEQLRPGRDHHEQIGRARLVQQLLEELEHGRVGPVQILDDQDQRPRVATSWRKRRHAMKDSSRLAAASLAVTNPTSGKPRLQPLALRGIVGDSPDRRVQLGRSHLRVVRFQDAGLGLDDLAEGPEADSLAEGQQRPRRQATSSGWASTKPASPAPAGSCQPRARRGS